MVRNFIKLAWRNMLKHRTFSFINITGLSISVAFCLLLFLHIRHEQSYDRFPKNRDRLFRFETTDIWPTSNIKSDNHFFSFFTKNDEVNNNLVTPLIVGRDIQHNFPEVNSILRIADEGGAMMRVNKNIYRPDHVLYAENNFFHTLSLPIVRGNPEALRASEKNAVISETTARKYFGDSDPIGRIIELVGDSNYVLTVAAIAADAPENSSIPFDIVLPLSSDPDYQDNIRQGFNQSAHLLLLELKDGVSANLFSDKLNRWAKNYFVKPYQKYLKETDFSNYKWYLRPFADCHYNVSSPWGHYTNARNLYQLAVLTIIILLISSLNYVLLAVSNAATRSQEIGVRKVMGANRKSVILQFWMETQIIVLISVVFGSLMMVLLLPLFNNITGPHLRLNEIKWRDIISAEICLCIVLGLLAGYYPAIFISKLKPVSILKSFRTFKINPNFSRILVLFQFTASVILMVTAFIINRQMHFISQKDLGFEKEQVIMVHNPVLNTDFTRHMKESLRNFASSTPFISAFSGMNGGLDGSNNNNGFILNGERRWRKQLTVDYDYFQMLGIQFTQGRPFSRLYTSDSTGSMRHTIINETLFKLLGNQAKVGEFCKPLNAIIIGVVKDYHFETLSKKIDPQEHVLAKDFEMVFMFKIKTGHLEEAVSVIGKEWKSLTDYPFEYHFLNETIAKMYDNDLRWEKTISISCMFAVFIACLGLFGLSAINAINRTKEIGIRKILGASVKDIATTLSSGFALIVLISILFATPISYWIMMKWLQNFAYRIDLSWWIFVVAGVTAFIVAMSATSFQTIKAAFVNPVESLRSE